MQNSLKRICYFTDFKNSYSTYVFLKLMFIMPFFFGVFEFLNYYYFFVFTVTDSQNPQSFESQFPGFQY